MKRFFIFLSSLILAIFLGLSIGREYETMGIMQYPGAVIIGTSAEVAPANREVFDNRITALAQETDSLVVKRLTEPVEGVGSDTNQFTYVAYGNKTLPSVFKLASQDSARTRSLVATYFIVSGSLSREVLAEEFSALGYRSVSEPGFSVMDQLMMVAVKSSSLVAIAIALLSFLSLTLIYRVKDLRFVGIRLISGESFQTVMFRSFRQDSLELMLATLLAMMLGLVILLSQEAFQSISVSVLSLGLVLYTGLQLLLSFALSLVYLLVVRQEVFLAQRKTSFETSHGFDALRSIFSSPSHWAFCEGTSIFGNSDSREGRCSPGLES